MIREKKISYINVRFVVEKKLLYFFTRTIKLLSNLSYEVLLIMSWKELISEIKNKINRRTHPKLSYIVYIKDSSLKKWFYFFTRTIKLLSNLSYEVFLIISWRKFISEIKKKPNKSEDTFKTIVSYVKGLSLKSNNFLQEPLKYYRTCRTNYFF